MSMSDETTEPPMNEKSASALARSVYADYTIWRKKKSKPTWHPVKKMRYVFFRMIDGCTIQDAIKEITWTASEFWHLLDLKRNAPFEMEYKRAKKLQARAIADTVQQIAEGRDTTTRRQIVKQQKLIKKALHRASKQKTALGAKVIIEDLLNRLNENDSKIIARNKLQIDAAKWLAKAANPTEFGDKANVMLGGIAPSGENGDARPIRIEFVAPDGSIVHPAALHDEDDIP